MWLMNAHNAMINTDVLASLNIAVVDHKAYVITRRYL